MCREGANKVNHVRCALLLPVVIFEEMNTRYEIGPYVNMKRAAYCWI